MHGAVHDYVVVKTVKDGDLLPSAEEQFGKEIKNYIDYKYKKLTEQPVFKKIFEIGSLDINGSMRTFNFINQGSKWVDLVGCEEYTGLDLIAGPSVDIIGNGHDVPFKNQLFDLVLCMNVLEHDADPSATVCEAWRVLKKGQPLILTCPNQNWGEHHELGGGDTETYNHITKEQLEKWLKKAGFQECEVMDWNNNLFSYSIK